MQRQVQYIPALISALRNIVGAAGDYYEAFYPVIKPYLVTDLSADQFNNLARYQLDDSGTEYVPGEAVAEGIFGISCDDEKIAKIIDRNVL